MFGNKQLEIDRMEDHNHCLVRIIGQKDEELKNLKSLRDKCDSLELELKARISENEKLKFQFNPPDFVIRK